MCLNRFAIRFTKLKIKHSNNFKTRQSFLKERPRLSFRFVLRKTTPQENKYMPAYLTVDLK